MHSVTGLCRKLVKTQEFTLDDHVYPVHYYVERTLRGVRRYSSEIILSHADRVILDDDSIVNLESKVARLVPASIYSRLLAARATAA